MPPRIQHTTQPKDASTRSTRTCRPSVFGRRRGGVVRICARSSVAGFGELVCPDPARDARLQKKRSVSWGMGEGQGPEAELGQTGRRLQWTMAGWKVEC